MTKEQAPERGASQTLVIESSPRRGGKWGVLGALTLVLAGMGVGKYMFGTDHTVPAEKIETVGPAVLRPWTPDLNSCYGGSALRLQGRNTRDNNIPIWGLPDIPLRDDVYSIEATVDHRLCIQGMANVGNNPSVKVEVIDQGLETEVTEIHIYQQYGALVMDRPRIRHTLCTEEEMSQEVNDCYIDYGQDSGTTDLIEALPFTDDTDGVRNRLLRYLEIQGANPLCLIEGFKKIPLSVLLLNDIESQAVKSGYDATRIKVYLYDSSGKLTNEWDSTAQQAIFDQEVSEFESMMPDNNDIDFSLECDVRDFGVLETDA